MFPMKILAWAACLAILLPACSFPAAMGEHPNIVLISIDTLRVDRLGFMGYSQPTSPVLDALAQKALRFPLAVTPAPLTLAAHATLLTGRQPWEHGIRDNANFSLPAGIPTLAGVLKNSGYRTGAFVSAFVLASQFGLARGFDRYSEPPLRLLKSASLAVPERPAEETTSAALEWLGASDGRPYFAWVHYYDPHIPYAPPARFQKRFKDPYDGEVAYVDEQIGRLLARLPDPSNTWVFIVSDHGEGLGDHGESSHSYFLYATTIRVLCLILPPPGRLKARISGDLATLADIYPTVLSITKTGAASTGGANLLSSPLPMGRRAAFETLYPFFHHGWSPLRGITDGRWWYIFAPTEELYDMTADPFQASNLATVEPARVRECQKAMEDMFSKEAPPQKTFTTPAASAENLQALGYLTGGWSRVPPLFQWKDYPDPKDRMEFLKAWERGLALLGEGKTREARTLLEQLLVQAPRDPEIRKVLGDLARREQDFAGALTHYREVLRLNPALEEVRLKEAQMLLRLDRIQDAGRELELYLAAIPNDPVALYYQGLLRAREGRHHEALEAYAQAQARGYDSPELIWRMSLSLIEMKEIGRARSLLEGVIQSNPTYAPAYYTLGTCASAQGKPAEAVKYFENAVNLEPGLLPAYLDLARTRLALGKDASGLTGLVDHVLSLDPGNCDALELMGDLRLQMREPDAARKAYRNAAQTCTDADVRRRIEDKLTRMP